MFHEHGKHLAWFWAGALVVVFGLIRPSFLNAAEMPPLEEIRQALRTHLPVPPDEGLLWDMNVNNVRDMLNRLDEHARLFTPDASPPLAHPETGRAGIGAELFIRDGSFLLSPYQGGALERAGVGERARLVAVDSEDVQGMSLDEVARLLRGTTGSRVELTVVPLSTDQPLRVRIRREAFRPLSVELLHRDVQVVLRLRAFSTGLTRTSLRTSIEYIGPQHRPLVLDLRESTGGDLHEALDAAALFVPEGSDLGGLRVPGRPEQRHRSPAGQKFSGPLVLLVGPDTASAAEAFAGILRHHGLAILVGRNTYGKCTTQTDIRLSEGWILRLTNGNVLFPGDAPCPEQGLIPDVLVSDQELYDLASLAARGLEAVRPISSPSAPPISDPELGHPLRQLEQEGRLTVRALRAWNRLPTRYVRLALDLLAMDLDLLGANVEQVGTWAALATGNDDAPLAEHAGDLQSLFTYIRERQWDDP
ncbi:S41 family peptidase [Desulfonatronum sp. SC1]|uniref:S41 family peptidase n=1 Tax=Desulfonatronum sp. SC1 TaxID=2109626 RepID=UPI001E5E6B34|nr:S41 family peptidase [Desulfonatronum sp. SC1]